MINVVLKIYFFQNVIQVCWSYSEVHYKKLHATCVQNVWVGVVLYLERLILSKRMFAEIVVDLLDSLGI